MRVGEQLRQDAMGSWHRALDTSVPGTIRILRADRVEDDSARLLMVEEIRRIGTLDHPFLLRVRQQDPSARRPWMLTDSIEGHTLTTFVEEHGPLPAAQGRSLAEGVLDALEHLAGRRQVHAGVVPGRVIQVDDQWRLLTFRDIRAIDELKALKGRKAAFPEWTPPERDKDHPVAFRPTPYVAWAVGGILRAALGGGAPRDPSGAFRPLPRTFPEAQRPIVLALSEPDPAARPQGAPAVRRVLQGDAPAAGSESSKAFKAPIPTRRRRPT